MSLTGCKLTQEAAIQRLNDSPLQSGVRYLRNLPTSPVRHMLSDELGRLLNMYEMEAQCGFTPGTAVARVKASDIKAIRPFRSRLKDG